MFITSGLSRETFKNFCKKFKPAKEKHIMKNFAVRSFVLALALAGIASTAMTSSASAANTSTAKSAIHTTTNIISSPTPMCPPNQKDGCGIL
jgi:hypothetical protein